MQVMAVVVEFHFQYELMELFQMVELENYCDLVQVQVLLQNDAPTFIWNILHRKMFWGVSIFFLEYKYSSSLFLV
jgi:hypothetical protein